MCRFWELTAAILGATDGTAAFWKKCALVKSLVALFGVWGRVNSTSLYESIPISFLVYTELVPVDLSACVWSLHT